MKTITQRSTSAPQSLPVLSVVSLLLLSLPQITWSSASYPLYYVWDESASAFTPRNLTTLQPKAPSLLPDFHTTNFEEGGGANGMWGEDGQVLSIFNQKQGGYFIDLAANEYKHWSNSYSLEQKRWKGVCIEANPKYLDDLLAYRRCKVLASVVGSHTGERLRFDFHDKDQVKDATIGGIIGEEFDNRNNNSESAAHVVGVSLHDILTFANAPRVIDYFSLDIEGGEYHAMKHFPFECWTFLIIHVERPNEKLHRLLSRNGYVFFAELTQNKFGTCAYAHRSLPNLVEVIQRHSQPNNGVPQWFGQARPYLLEVERHNETRLLLDPTSERCRSSVRGHHSVRDF